MDDLTFSPDYVISPGEILEETLESNGIPKGEFARRLGISLKTLSLIIAGKAPVSPTTALQIEQVLGVSARLWSNLEAQYRLALARLESKNKNEQLVEWAKKFPITEMRRRGVIHKSAKDFELVQAIFLFFKVASSEAWDNVYGQLGNVASFRRSATKNLNLHFLATWLRFAQVAAENIETPPFDKRKFVQSITHIRSFICESPAVFMEPLKRLCASAGVVLLINPSIPGCGAYGVTGWLSKGKAFIALSNLRKSDDQFWFSFFHEAGHILLHGKDCIFIETNDKENSDNEIEADTFARNIIFPNGIYEEFVHAGHFYEPNILEFSSRSKVPPGIVTGFLQHDDLIDKKWHNGLKEHFELEEFL